MSKRSIRAVAIVLTTALILSAFPLFAYVSAATEFTVTNAEEYYNAITSTDVNKIIHINADFEMSSGTESGFAGVINGNGHIITISSQTALFNVLSGTVNDLGIIVSDSKPIQRPQSVSELPDSDGKTVWSRGILANVISGTINNCFVYGELNVNFSEYSDVNYVGGLCGYATDSAIVKNSFSCVSIISTNAACTGGFIGYAEESATVTSCYSSGDIDAANGHVAGFSNVAPHTTAANIADTYTSCQIIKLSNDALPSGVNGVYDNQLSLMRENSENAGLSTAALMSTDTLSDVYAVTSTAYPALKTFYGDQWSEATRNVVAVSTAAAVFSDTDPAMRMEPSGVQARTDYLTLDCYVDRTNVNSLSWSVSSEACKVYDTVPSTSFNQTSSANMQGTAADLLRARLLFSKADAGAVMTAAQNGFSRKWYLNAYAQNPYFDSGNGATADTAFAIANKDQLNHVRFYALITNASYQLSANVAVNEFDPIVDFVGVFNGNGHTLSEITLADDRDGDLALFANTCAGAAITNLTLQNVNAVTETTDRMVGALIGNAVQTTVNNVILCGGANTVESLSTAGGLIGRAENCTLTELLVSVEVNGVTAGGIVGEMNGGTLNTAGVTGGVGVTGTTIGGLVGSANASADIADSYSTAVVISDQDSAVAGGLIGQLSTDSSVTDSYSSAFAEAATSKPLVGNGTAGDGCCYDGQFYSEDSTSVAFDGDTWTITEGYYPQLSAFVGKELSLLSTKIFFYQQYWPDADADNMTTGWIPATFSDSGSFAKPSVPTLFADSTKITVYDVQNTAGFGFEPASGQYRVVLKTTDTAKAVGVRYAAALRDDLIALRYTVDSTEETLKETRTYVELSYSTDGGANWTQYHTVSLCDVTADTVYDIPKNSKIRVRVYTADEHAVESCYINDTLTDMVDGAYTSVSAFDEAVTVAISLTDGTPVWGVRRETY